MRHLIGPGGTTLRAIEESSGAKICVNDNDAVYVYAATEAGFKRCNDAIAEITGRGIKVPLQRLQSSLCIRELSKEHTTSCAQLSCHTQFCLVH